jgi:transposase
VKGQAQVSPFNREPDDRILVHAGLSAQLATCYHKAREAYDILAKHEDHMMLMWLPTYSPELNAIEGPCGDT